MDSRQFNVFFATYRTFATPLKVLNLLIKLFDDNVTENFQNYINRVENITIQNSILIKETEGLSSAQRFVKIFQ